MAVIEALPKLIMRFVIILFLFAKTVYLTVSNVTLNSTPTLLPNVTLKATQNATQRHRA